MPQDLPPIRGIHIDLKYLMPRKGLLKDWVRRMPEWGINAILLEYEDKFPFQRYPFLRDPDAFTPDELRDFLDTVRGAGLLCIPLVQSISHLEFALAHEELAHLREAPDVPTQICPCKPEAVDFVCSLFAEVLEYHREDPLFHCGGDEAWFLGTCDECRARLAAIGPVAMWAEHQKKILDVVLDAGKRPIVWDDIFRKDRHALEQVGLPKTTVLHAWNYGITELGAKRSGKEDEELGGFGGVLEEIGIYKAAGYDSIAGPCFNYGELFPRIEHSIKNTRVWATKMRDEQMPGMLNTAWASFHMPMEMTNLLIAATGALCRDPDADLGLDWQARWLAEEFGAEAAGVPEALEELGRPLEVPLKKTWGRPFSPVVYCYMNLVMHYPGRQDERRKRGAYPLDWGEIDFVNVYRTGIRASRESDALADVLETLDARLAAYAQAVPRVKQFAAAAGRRREAARMMSVFADMKSISARAFSHLMRGDGDAAALRGEMEAIRPALQDVLARIYEPVGRERMLRAWWEPAYEAMGAP